MPSGASPKREREYRALKRKFKRNDRYRGREEEVASRIVNQQRRKQGETQAQKSRKRHGQREDQRDNAPLRNYKELTVPEVKSRMHNKPEGKLKDIRKYERAHKDRKTLVQAIDRELKNK